MLLQSPEAARRRPTAPPNRQSYVTLRTSAKGLTVYPLDGAGRRLAALEAKDVVRGGAGFRIHIQADGQAFALWYEIVAE